MRVPDSTQIKGSAFENKNKIKFFENFLKKSQKRHISKTTSIRAVIFRGKIRNFGEYPDSTQLQVKEFQIWKKKFCFLKTQVLNYKKYIKKIEKRLKKKYRKKEDQKNIY